MKKLYGTLLLLLVGSYSFGQFGISFNDTLKPFGEGAYGIENVVKDSNHYYTLGVYNSSNGQFPFVLELDLYGQITNKKLYVDTPYKYAPYPYNSFILNGNKLLFCSQEWGTSEGTLGFICAVEKHTLDTLWTKTYLHPDTLIAQTAQDVFSVLTAIKSTPDGGYILTGNYNKDCITGNLISFLMKIDSVGNVKWRRTYTNYYTFFDIEVAPDSGYYVPSGYNGTNALQVVKFNKDGVYQWKVGVTTNNMAGYPVEISSLGTNFAIVGFKYLYDVANHYTAVSVSKVNLISKTIVWEKVYYIYKKFQCVSMHQAMGVETLLNGDIIVSGTAINFGNDAIILKLNSNGDSLWCKSYDFTPDPYDCQLNDLIVTDDGGFMGVGFWSDQGGPGWTAWMFKTDSNGVVGFESEPSRDSVSLLKVYPNPVRDNIIIELPEILNDYNVKIYNAQGQTVMYKSIHKGKTQESFNLSKFKSGVYFIELIQGDKIIGTEKFIKD